VSGSDPPAKRRRTPSQSRSRELVRAIVEAAGRIVSSEPDGRAGGFSTNHVARIAGVSIGSLYQYFPSKSAIVAALAHARLRDTFEPLLEDIDASSGRTLEEAVSRLVDRFVAMKIANDRVDAGVVKATVRHGLTDDAFALDEQYVERFAAAIERWKPRVREDLPSDIAAYVLFQSLRATMILGSLHRPALLADERFARELKHLLVAYLSPRSA
jgi:AcrR family transcriptional regulator